MAQITPVPQSRAVLVERQLDSDVNSLLSAGLSAISSILPTEDPSPTSTTTSTSITSSSRTSTSSSSPSKTSTTSTTSNTLSSKVSSSTQSSTLSSTSSSTKTTQSLLYPGSATETASPTSSSTTASAASSTSSPIVRSANRDHILPIVLGSVLGFVTLALLLLLIFLCIRRRQKYGAVFARRSSTPSLRSDDDTFVGSGGPGTANEPKENSSESSTGTRDISPPPENFRALSIRDPWALNTHSREHSRGEPFREPAYPPLPAPHQISSIGGRRHSEYAYVPNDPFDNGLGAMGYHDRDREREMIRRQRLSMTLDPVHEVPEHPLSRAVSARRRSTSDPRWMNISKNNNIASNAYGHNGFGPVPGPQRPTSMAMNRRWTAGPGMYGVPNSNWQWNGHDGPGRYGGGGFAGGRGFEGRRPNSMAFDRIHPYWRYIPRKPVPMGPPPTLPAVSPVSPVSPLEEEKTNVTWNLQRPKSR
ncbi:hypothetical protein BT63DRAFT_295465 [Microthyrium microscopicum]|uniref:Mid2 domain-containing protein n=1 Tax=Microthyrium microscopicum TaxID=703497 RepID=A0A6A6U824_9PEZI|nr:hypothetical protein BT63DRAFT_295465 [Microthyrium microscopicum]